MRVCLVGGASSCTALLGFLMKLSWLLASSVMATLLSRVTALICSTTHPVADHRTALVPLRGQVLLACSAS